MSNERRISLPRERRERFKPAILRLKEYRATIATGRGLTAGQWDDFDAIEKHLDPAAYEARYEAGARSVALDYARKLSVEDLEEVLKEKRLAAAGYK